MKLCTGK